MYTHSRCQTEAEIHVGYRFYLQSLSYSALPVIASRFPGSRFSSHFTRLLTHSRPGLLHLGQLLVLWHQWVTGDNVLEPQVL
jgi:hypothetical protein